MNRRRQAQPEGEVRIIAGRWRSRRIRFPANDELRPTGDRIRETLFSWLQPSLPGARVIDLFAGSGILGMEAASRGAESVVLVEKSTANIQYIRKNINNLVGQKRADDRLGCDTLTNDSPPPPQFELIPGDALSYLGQKPDPCDILFLDPPFTGDLLAISCQMAAEREWLRRDGVIYLEQSATSPIAIPPPGWTCARERRMAGVQIQLLTRIS